MGRVALQATGFASGFTVNDLQRSIRFYEEGLGFEVKSRNEVNGKLQWVELKAGQAEIAIGQDDFLKGKDRVKGVAVRLWISTGQDLRALAAQAKAAGIRLDKDVSTTPWGQETFEVTDPDGFKLTIAGPR